VVVLIDDYDVPLALILEFEKKEQSEQMGICIKNLLDDAANAEMVLVTGGYRLDNEYYDCFGLEPDFHSSYFGFTEAECSELRAGFNVDAELCEMIRFHYNGEWSTAPIHSFIARQPFFSKHFKSFFLLGYRSIETRGSNCLYSMTSMVRFLDDYARTPGKCASVYSEKGQLRDVKFAKYFKKNKLLDQLLPAFKDPLVAAAVRHLVNRELGVTVSSITYDPFSVGQIFLWTKNNQTKFIFALPTNQPKII
jgi:hypothetical protein